MRELEFLPPWYIKLLRLKAMTRIQFWITFMVLAGLCVWICVADQKSRKATRTLKVLTGQLAATDNDLKQMDRLESLRKQWRQQAEALERLGVHVQSLRVIEKLVDALPQTVSLVVLSVEVEETLVPLNGIAKAAQKDSAAPLMDRKLRIRAAGVAPSDVELATFLTELQKVPFFEQVTPSFSRDRREAGHLLREFEVSFMINLNIQGEK